MLFTIQLRNRSSYLLIVRRKRIAGVMFYVISWFSRSLPARIFRWAVPVRSVSSELFRNEKALHSAGIISSHEKVYPCQIRFSAKILGDSTRRRRQHLPTRVSRTNVYRINTDPFQLHIARPKRFSLKGLFRSITYKQAIFPRFFWKRLAGFVEGDQFVNRVLSVRYGEKFRLPRPLVSPHSRRSASSRCLTKSGAIVPAGSSGPPVRSFRYPRRIYFPRPPDWSQVHDGLIPYDRNWPRRFSTPPSIGVVCHHNSCRPLPLCSPSSPTIASRHPT